MPNKKISELAASGALTGTELIETVQGGANVQTTTQAIANLGGGGTWGSITGTLSGQTDLQAALDNKSDAGATIVTDTGAYTLQASDLTLINAGATLIIDGDGTDDLTVPLNATVAFPVGTFIGVRDYNNIVATGGVTITGTSGSLAIPAGMTVTLEKTATNTWILHNGSDDSTKVDEETFATLADGATVTWDNDNRQSPLAKLTSTQSFTINMTNVKSGAHGILKLITNTASAITMTFDTDFTNKSLNTTFTTYTFPAATGREYFLEYVVDGTLMEWSIYAIAPISDPSGSDDDILQRKAGAWANRTLSQVRTDLDIKFSFAIGGSLSTVETLTNMALAEQCVPNNNNIHTFKMDATNLRQCRITCRVSALSGSANNPRLYPQYSTDSGSNWITIGAGTIVSGDAISLLSTGFGKTTNWIDLPAGAKADVLFRVAQAGGDGAADPSVGTIHFQFR